MTVPCKNCQDRVVGCHISCEKYKAWKDYNEQVKMARNTALGIDYFLKEQGARRHKNPRRERK